MTKHTKSGAKALADQKSREEYNEQINKILPQFKDLELTSPHVVVKLFKYDSQTTTASGVINPRQVEKYSDSGKVGAKLDNVEFKPVALVVKVSPKAAELFTDNKVSISPGEVVWIDPKAVGQNTVLLTDRVNIKPTFEGYVKLHPSQIEFKDKSAKYELEYGE